MSSLFGFDSILCYCFLLNSLNFCSGAELSNLPTCNYATSGGTAVLPCFVTGHTSGIVNWGKDNQIYIQIDSSGNLNRPVDIIIGSDGIRYQVEVDYTASNTYWGNLTITSVIDDDSGDYSCGPGINDETGELLLAVDANNIFVKFNGDKYTNSSYIGTIDRQSYTLIAVAENSKPQTTFIWSITDDGMKGKTVISDSDTSGTCGPFNSTSSLNLDFSTFNLIDFIITLTATNEITGNVTTIELNGTISTDTTTLQSTYTTKSDGTSPPKNNVTGTVKTGESTSPQPLSLGTIIGIIVGIVGLISLIALIIYIIRVKLFSKTSRAFTIDPKSSCV